MHSFKVSGVCLLLASIAALLLSKDGVWQNKSSTSRSTATPEESDFVFMLQAKGGVELALAKKKNAKRMNAEFAKVRTAIQNPDTSTVNSALAPNAESEVMTTAGSDNGSLQPYLRLSLASVETWRSKVMAQSLSMSLPLIMLLLLVGCSGTAGGYFIFIRWKGHVDETAYEMAEARDGSLSASDMRPPPCPELSSPASSGQTSPPNLQRASLHDVQATSPSERISLMKEARFSLPMNPLREAVAKGKSQTNIVILNSAGDAYLRLAIGAGIEVSTMQDESGRRVVVEPQPNTSQANSRPLMIHAQNVILPGKNNRLREMSATFDGSLEEQGDGSYTVLHDQQPVMYLHASPDAHQLSVTTDHWELACVRHDAGDRLDIRVHPNADAILVLACALAVVRRLFV